MHHTDISTLRHEARSLDDHAFMLRTNGDREQAAAANIKAQVLRELADELSGQPSEPAEGVSYSHRGQALVYKHDTPLTRVLLALAIVAFFLALLFGLP